jgi:hypothetical protein
LLERILAFRTYGVQNGLRASAEMSDSDPEYAPSPSPITNLVGHELSEGRKKFMKLSRLLANRDG